MTAACGVLVAAGVAEPDWWTGDASGAELGRAADVCAACPLAAECLRAGLARENHGLWGGVWLSLDRGPRLVPGEALRAELDAGGRAAWMEWRAATRPVLEQRIADAGGLTPVACGASRGTRRGYGLHELAGERACDACRERHNAARPLPTREAQHGTTAGAAWHYRHGVPLCDECRGAERRDRADRRARHAARRPVVPLPPTGVCGEKHGTLTGYGRHQAAFERPCEACREAHNRARRKAAS